MIKHAMTVLIMFVIPATVQADDFKSQPAKDARQKYEAALAAARMQYLNDLNEAAKKAVDGGDLDEVVRIKAAQEGLRTTEAADDNDDSQELTEQQVKLNKARQLIEGTTWKWKPEGTFTVRSSFLENRRVKHASTSWKEPHFGEWDMLEEHTLVMRRRPEGLWAFFFEDDYQSFRVMKLVPGEYKGSIGTRSR